MPPMSTVAAGLNVEGTQSCGQLEPGGFGQVGRGKIRRLVIGLAADFSRTKDPKRGLLGRRILKERELLNRSSVAVSEKNSCAMICPYW